MSYLGDIILLVISLSEYYYISRKKTDIGVYKISITESKERLLLKIAVVFI